MHERLSPSCVTTNDRINFLAAVIVEIGDQVEPGALLAEVDPRDVRNAADQGFAQAQYSLGGMYARGFGVPADNVLAYMWVNLAAAQGILNSRQSRDLLAERITREQIAEGQRLSTEWLGSPTCFP